MSSPHPLFADIATLDKSGGWARIDLAAHWESDFWPLLRDSEDLRFLHENCVNAWLKMGRADRPSRRRWTYSETAEAPFFFTSTDGAVMWVDDRIEKAKEAEDPAAFAHESLMNLLCGDYQLQLPKAVKNKLWREANRIEELFHPKREKHPQWWRPGHSCFWFAPFALGLAKAWRPNLSWQILEGDLHATVVCQKEKLIFDLLLWDDMTTDLIAFASSLDREDQAA